MTENQLPVINASSCGCSAGSCTCGTHAEHGVQEHIHGEGCGHDQSAQADAGPAGLEAMFTEITYLMNDRFGEPGPNPEQEKEFMREWLTSKGRTVEEVDAILAGPQDA